MYSTTVVTKTAKDAFVNELLRGLAVIAVVGLHLLSIPHGIYNDSHTQLFAVGIDQLLRFCVPLFVAMSGYGFWMKYQNLELNPFRFWWSQIKKLLPAYIVACLVFYLVFTLLPQWQSPTVTRSLLIQILTGQADYHLYFVPMIFQMYFLFPIIIPIVKKLPWTSLVMFAVFQAWLYMQYNATVLPPLVMRFLLTDQQQYFWWFSWVFYFVLGMHLPKILSQIRAQKWLGIVLALTVFLSWLVMVYQCVSALNHGIDPIIVLRTTRLTVLIYASFCVVFLFAAAKGMSNHLQKMCLFFQLLGKHSYVIYLYHTLVLRFLFNKI